MRGMVGGRGVRSRAIAAVLAIALEAGAIAAPAGAGSSSPSPAPTPAGTTPTAVPSTAAGTTPTSAPTADAAAPVPTAATAPTSAPAPTSTPPPSAAPSGSLPSAAPTAPIVGPRAPAIGAFPGDEWAGDRPPSPEASFRRRTFPLPASVAWRRLFPAGRWVGPAEATGPVDAAGLPMREDDKGRRWYTATNLGIQALRRLDGYRMTGDAAYLASARRMADKLRELAVHEGRAIWLPFPYDEPRARMKAPWVNALGQAVALSLFSRLHRLEGDPQDLAFAVGLFESFRQLRRPDGPWVSELDEDGYLWFEHYPDGTRGHVLNAHAYAVLALRDYWQETRSPEARRWLEGGLATLRDKGVEFRRPGTWSRYNLRDPVAHANYHLFHVRQLRALAFASGDRWFDALADVFVEDYQGNQPWRYRERDAEPRAPGAAVGSTTGPTPAASPPASPTASPSTPRPSPVP